MPLISSMHVGTLTYTSAKHRPRIGGHSRSSACSRASPVPPLHLQLPVPSVRHGGVTPKPRDFSSRREAGGAAMPGGANNSQPALGSQSKRTGGPLSCAGRAREWLFPSLPRPFPIPSQSQQLDDASAITGQSGHRAKGQAPEPAWIGYNCRR
jgi:hypothetical protein